MLVCGFVSTFCDNYNCLMHAIKKLDFFFLDCFVRHVTIQVDIYIYIWNKLHVHVSYISSWHKWVETNFVGGMNLFYCG